MISLISQSTWYTLTMGMIYGTFLCSLMLIVGYQPLMFLTRGLKTISRIVLQSYGSDPGPTSTAIMYGGLLACNKQWAVLAFTAYFFMMFFVWERNPSEMISEILATLITIVLIPLILVVAFDLMTPMWMCTFAIGTHFVASLMAVIIRYPNERLDLIKNSYIKHGTDKYSLFCEKLKHDINLFFNHLPTEKFIRETTSNLSFYCAAFLEEVHQIQLQPVEKI